MAKKKEENPFKNFDKTQIVWEIIDPKFHWIVKEGIKTIESGKTPGKNMTYFLQQMNVI